MGWEAWAHQSPDAAYVVVISAEECHLTGPSHGWLNDAMH